jgi:hypothetical protein
MIMPNLRLLDLTPTLHNGLILLFLNIKKYILRVSAHQYPWISLKIYQGAIVSVPQFFSAT